MEIAKSRVMAGHCRVDPMSARLAVRLEEMQMKIDLSGKVALVTGSTEGIGFAISRGLQDAGAEVVINGRTRQKVDAAIARLGGRARGQAIDLAAADGCLGADTGRART